MIMENENVFFKTHLIVLFLEINTWKVTIIVMYRYRYTYPKYTLTHTYPHAHTHQRESTDVYIGQQY